MAHAEQHLRPDRADPTGRTGGPDSPDGPDGPDSPDSPDSPDGTGSSPGSGSSGSPGSRAEGPPPRWARPALWAILALAALLYLWDVSSLGDANSFYSAAVYSGTQSWKAFFYGSLDAGGFITVDKPPFALWVMGLSCRVFGFGTWQMMLPMAAAGVASVALLHRMVRTCFGYAAATVAALVLALTPMTVAITRDNNPDPVLVLLMLLGAHGTLRAIRTGRLLPLVGAAVAIGFAFQTKMLQAYIVLPAFCLAYVVAAPGGLARRLRHLAVAAVALVVSSGWWMAVVDLVPAGSRPFVGGSADNTVWDLVIGYNGLGRVFGESGGGPGGGGGGGGGFGGTPGIGRLFNEINGGQISWLIPFAVLALVVALVLRGRRPRTDLQRAALLLWGGWFVVHHLVFSLSEGTFHPYYVTAMAPGVAALCGAGGVALYGAFRRDARWARWAWALPLAVAGTAVWAVVLLGRTDGWNSWLRPAVAVVAALAVAALLVARFGTVGRAADRRRMTTVAALAAVVAMLAGPSAYAVSTAASSSGGAMNGTNPTAGPTTGDGMGGPGGGPPDGPGGGRPGGKTGVDGSPGKAGSGGRGAPGGTGGEGGGQQPPGGQAPPGGGGRGMPGGGTGGQPPSGGGAMGGGLGSKTLAYLKKHKDGATWLLAVADDQSAASAILASRQPVASMGGWSGSDDAMTVAKLKKLVEEGRLHYVQAGQSGGGAGGPGRPGGGSASEVEAWVKKHGTKVKSVGTSLYRLDPSDVTGQAE